MLLSDDQMNLVACILITVAGASYALDKLLGLDLVQMILGKGLLMKIFVILVLVSVIYSIMQKLNYRPKKDDINEIAGVVSRNPFA